MPRRVGRVQRASRVCPYSPPSLAESSGALSDAPTSTPRSTPRSLAGLVWGLVHALVGDASDFAKLLHQIELGVQPACRIHDEQIGLSALAGTDSIIDDRSGISSRLVGDDGYARAFPPYLELVDGGCTERIGRG